MRFHPKYFWSAILLFLIEVLIAVFFKDRLIRAWVGDVLVVILIYCLIQAFWRVRVTAAVVGVFGFACMVEGLQYFGLVNRLGWQDHQLLATIIGTAFDWKDIWAYATGSVIVLGWESKVKLGKQ
jgi:hypothetical protein